MLLATGAPLILERVCRAAICKTVTHVTNGQQYQPGAVGASKRPPT